MKQHSTMLKVSSIILIIGGVFNLIIGLMAVATGGVAEAIQANNAWVLVCAAILLIVLGAIDFYAGIVGVKASSGNGNSERCKKLAVLVMVIAIISLVSTILGGAKADNFVQTLVGSLLSLVIPLLYYAGANKVSE